MSDNEPQKNLWLRGAFALIAIVVGFAAAGLWKYSTIDSSISTATPPSISPVRPLVVRNNLAPEPPSAPKEAATKKAQPAEQKPGYYKGTVPPAPVFNEPLYGKDGKISFRAAKPAGEDAVGNSPITEAPR